MTDEGADGDDDPDDKGDDPEAVEVEDEYAQKVMDEAEEMCPGMKRPVGDSAHGKFTKGLIDRVKRQALDGAGIKEFGDSATLEGAALDTAFKAALMLKRSAKNPRAKSFGDSRPSVRPSNAELNKRFAAFWK